MSDEGDETLELKTRKIDIGHVCVGGIGACGVLLLSAHCSLLTGSAAGLLCALLNLRM